jgi:hypothetical protein
LLPDGKVLMAACGILNELYDPVTGTFSRTGTMSGNRCWGLTATLLTNGKVLVAGGDPGLGSIGEAELYDPPTGSFTATKNMTTARWTHTATLIPDGGVLIAGGEVYPPTLANAEVYDPVTDTFTATGNMGTWRGSHTATLLNDGTVLITGGVSYGERVVGSAEIYHPPSVVRALVTTNLRVDRTVVAAGTSYSVNATGSNLSAETFFDIRFRAPGERLEQEALNWQRGTSESHIVTVGTVAGNWTITGVRAHQFETDYTGSFFPVLATIGVSP